MIEGEEISKSQTFYPVFLGRKSLKGMTPVSYRYIKS